MAVLRRILLLGHTHHDVGYTNSPRIIDDAHRNIVGEVVRLAEANPDFRWTFEVARPVLRFLAEAPAAEVEALARLHDEGRISVTGGYLNNTTLPSEVELDAAYEQLQRMREAGLEVRTEQHGDVNGIPWGAVEGMARAGISRLVMALNPDHGRPPFTQPSGFWWEGVSGARVFVWLSTHYGFGEEWGIVDADVALARRRIEEFVEQLSARDDYPFDTALVHAGNDNRWPTALFLEVVRDWNAAHPELPMETTTIDAALDVLEEQGRGADLPVVRGEWSDWWSHGHGSTAREVAVYREARSFTRAAQTSLALTTLRGDGEPKLATVLGYRRGPVRLRDDDEVQQTLAAVDEQLLLFGEHTWGSWETYSKPFSNLSHSHWNAKAGMAYSAYDLARDLAIEGMFRVAASGSGDPAEREGVLVLNPSERERTEPVTVEVRGGAKVRTVATVPAFGAALLPTPAPAQPRTGRTIELGSYRVEVDPARGGVVSLVDVRTGAELVDSAAAHGLGSVVVESVVAGSEHPMLTRNPKDFHPDFPGPDFDRLPATGDAEPELLEGDGYAQLRWTTTPPGLPPAVTTLTVHRDTDLVDLEVALQKPEAFGPESIFVAFPFATADPEFLLETAGAVFAAESEQLPDTSKDWYSIQHAIGVHGDGPGVLWGTVDAPLVQLGGFHTGEWARTLTTERGHINSWLMNNFHFTNFQARQEGTRVYRYRFAASPAVSRESVRLFGRDLAEPLQARHYEGPAFEGGSGLRVDAMDAVVAELRPLGGGAVRVRLRNVGAEAAEATVGWSGDASVDGGGTVGVPGHGVTDLVLRRRDV